MTTVSLSIPGDLRFALPAPVYWLHGSLMQHLLLPVNILMSKISDSQSHRHGLDMSSPYECLCFIPFWWAWVESNYRPHPYQGCALAN